MELINGIIYNDGKGENQHIFSTPIEINRQSLVDEFNLKTNVLKNDENLNILHLESTNKNPSFMSIIQKVYIDMDSQRGLKNRFNTKE